MNENDNKQDAGPIGKKKNGVSPLKVVLIIFLCFMAALAYKIYVKVSGFLSFVSGEIDAVSSSIQNFQFSVSGPNPMDEGYDGNIDIIGDSEEDFTPEDEGEEAIRLEIPAAGIDESSKEQKTSTQKNILPFNRKLTPFELSATKNSSSKIEKGIFKGYSKTVLKDSIGTTSFIHSGADIYQFAFFPDPSKYADANAETRIIIADDAFKMLIDKIYGNDYFEKNIDALMPLQKEFAKKCSTYKEHSWTYTAVNEYSFGCSMNGFKARHMGDSDDSVLTAK